MAIQLWSTNTAGGFMYSDELSDQMRTDVRAQAKFRQLCDAQDFTDKGLGNGSLVTWNVYSKLATSGTTLGETQAMPESNFTITQGTATVVEWGISVPFTSLLTKLAKHDVEKVVRDTLARDAREVLDRAAHAEFNRTMLRYVAANGTTVPTLITNGTTTGTNNSALNKFHVRALVDTMKERNIPTFAGDDYMAILRPTTLRPLRNELEAVNQYTETGYGKIMRGEVGRFEGCRFIEQTNVNRGVNNAGVAWTSNQSDWAYFFGADTVGEVIAEPMEVRGKIPSDFGRSHGIAWYAIEGFGIVYSAAADPTGLNSRIIKWDSAA